MDVGFSVWEVKDKTIGKLMRDNYDWFFIVWSSERTHPVFQIAAKQSLPHFYYQAFCPKWQEHFAINQGLIQNLNNETA
jgi:hypothetical protein